MLVDTNRDPWEPGAAPSLLVSMLGKYPQNCQDEESYQHLGLSPGREQERSQVGDWASPRETALALGRKRWVIVCTVTGNLGN